MANLWYTDKELTLRTSNNASIMYTMVIMNE
jgi:hypothetical protein